MVINLVIVDYGAGNLRSVSKALERIGFPASVTSDPGDVLDAAGVILPGVGSSGAAMAALEDRDLVKPLRHVVAQGTPFFGVCLGMQLLLDTSEEDPRPCLGIVPGGVTRLPSSVKVPHMGWNQVTLLRKHPVFYEVPTGANFYFVHSYYAEPEDVSLVVGATDYGVPFCSVLARDNLVATQFHPEKSGPLGLRLYENFIRLMVLRGVRQSWR
ncbi:MAG: imidazole glycerol phosphate synthase subunit HisH [Chloroflexi bacterium]|nr:imidazole glycerol phosphate synthase subunit HisH [Chloroflexota bacterium]